MPGYYHIVDYNPYAVLFRPCDLHILYLLVCTSLSPSLTLLHLLFGFCKHVTFIIFLDENKSFL